MILIKLWQRIRDLESRLYELEHELIDFKTAMMVDKKVKK